MPRLERDTGTLGQVAHGEAAIVCCHGQGKAVGDQLGQGNAHLAVAREGYAGYLCALEEFSLGATNDPGYFGGFGHAKGDAAEVLAHGQVDVPAGEALSSTCSKDADRSRGHVVETEGPGGIGLRHHQRATHAGLGKYLYARSRRARGRHHGARQGRARKHQRQRANRAEQCHAYIFSLVPGNAVRAISKLMSKPRSRSLKRMAVSQQSQVRRTS